MWQIHNKTYAIQEIYIYIFTTQDISMRKASKFNKIYNLDIDSKNHIVDYVRDKFVPLK